MLFVEPQVFFDYGELLAKCSDALGDLERALFVFEKEQVSVDRVLETELRVVLLCFFYSI